MTSPEVWPAYHGWGGSYDIDVQKHFDILETVLRQEGRAEPFDTMIDIGANSGFITEKLTARHFARNFILVEAYKGMKDLFDTRFGNTEFNQRWQNEQVSKAEGAQAPEFEFLNFAVNDKSQGTVDLCTNNMWSEMNKNVPCPVDKLAMDDMVPGRLSPGMQDKFADSHSAYVKLDVEGMDELALRGMSRLLKEERGAHHNGSPRHLINFIQFEYSPILQKEWKDKEGLANYDLKTVTEFMESMGFETFLMGPRYLPLSHGSWDDAYKWFTEDPENSFGGSHFPAFWHMSCPGPECPVPPIRNVLAADIFALRSSHPMAKKIKLGLGVCKESYDFDLGDAQYAKAK
jgi:FkbM family methyltransferase